MSVVQLKNVSKRFDSITAVSSLNLDIEKDEIFGFLGPNGAGKTTTIRLIIDFIRPTSGQIKIFGEDLAINPHIQRSKIGYLSCENTTFGGWTGREHFDFIQSVRGLRSENLKSLIERFDFNPKIISRKLSSGNLQKLNIILSLMFNPELIILDEPTKALDPLLQKEMFKALTEFNKAGSTIFMSSHNLSEVESFCTRAGIIKSGKLVSTEAIKNLKAKQMFNVEFSATEKIDKKIFKHTTIDSFTSQNGVYTIKIKGDINPTLKILSGLKIKDISIGKASLEEIFMEFYR